LEGGEQREIIGRPGNVLMRGREPTTLADLWTLRTTDGDLDMFCCTHADGDGVRWTPVDERLGSKLVGSNYPPQHSHNIRQVQALSRGPRPQLVTYMVPIIPPAAWAKHCNVLANLVGNNSEAHIRAMTAAAEKPIPNADLGKEMSTEFENTTNLLQDASDRHHQSLQSGASSGTSATATETDLPTMPDATQSTPPPAAAPAKKPRAKRPAASDGAATAAAEDGIASEHAEDATPVAPKASPKRHAHSGEAPTFIQVSFSKEQQMLLDGIYEVTSKVDESDKEWADLAMAVKSADLNASNIGGLLTSILNIDEKRFDELRKLPEFAGILGCLARIHKDPKCHAAAVPEKEVTEAKAAATTARREATVLKKQVEELRATAAENKTSHDELVKQFNAIEEQQKKDEAAIVLKNERIKQLEAKIKELEAAAESKRSVTTAALSNLFAHKPQ